jgi:hypothetical protein
MRRAPRARPAALQEAPILIDILDYSDGQVLAATEGSTVVIDDICNKMRLNLYQTDQGERFAYVPRYKRNVLRWFESAKAALIEQRYLEPASEKYASTLMEQYRVLRTHRFSKLVDRYLPALGIRSSVPSRLPGHADEIAITIPGSVEFLDTLAKRVCLFVYYVDSADGQCFHRNIQFKNAFKVIADFYKKGFFDVEFPLNVS